MSGTPTRTPNEIAKEILAIATDAAKVPGLEAALVTAKTEAAKEC